MKPSKNFGIFSCIKKQLENIADSVSFENKSRMHYKSVRNFITCYPLLKRETQKAIELIEEYFKFIEKNHFFLTEEESQNAFNLYISPLGGIYRRQIGFSSQFAILFEFMLYVIPNGFGWLIFNSKLLFALILPFYLIHWVRYIIRYQKNK